MQHFSKSSIVWYSGLLYGCTFKFPKENFFLHDSFGVLRLKVYSKRDSNGIL